MSSHLFNLTPQQSFILHLLSARFGLRYGELAKALYGDKAPQGAKNTITVQLHHIRKALQPFAIEIVTYEPLGGGNYRYAVPLRCREALAELLDRRAEQSSVDKIDSSRR